VTRQDFWQLIIRLLADGVAVVVSTPYMDEAARCNRLGFMAGGRILLQGPPRQLTGLLAGRVLMLFCDRRAVARSVCQADPDVEDVAAFGERLHLRISRRPGARSGSQETLERLRASLSAAGVRVDELTAIPPSLEDVFIALKEGALGG
jgi:ABC-2 type transport system ATP-binding protein